MLLRALACVLSLGLLLAACGPEEPRTEGEICGPGGCDACIGFTCGVQDGGTR